MFPVNLKKKKKLAKKEKRKRNSNADAKNTQNWYQKNGEWFQGNDDSKATNAVSDDWYQWNGEWYQWSDGNTENTEAFNEKTAKRDRVNTRLRNWIAAMRRNMRPECVETVLKTFTITRDKMDEVNIILLDPIYAPK